MEGLLHSVAADKKGEFLYRFDHSEIDIADLLEGLGLRERCRFQDIGETEFVVERLKFSRTELLELGFRPIHRNGQPILVED